MPNISFLPAIPKEKFPPKIKSIPSIKKLKIGIITIKAIIKEANYAPVMMAHGVSTNVCRGAYFFQTPMRSAPSFTATGDFIRSYGTPTAASSATAVSTKYSHSIDWTASGVTALNQGILVTFKTGDASLIYSAEL